MKVIHEIEPPKFKAALGSLTAQVQLDRTRRPTGHLLERMGSSIKRLLVVGLLTLSLSALAGDPTATDVGRFIKFMGKQAVTSPVEDDDSTYIRKSAIIRFESTKQLVTITLTTGSLTFAFETKAAAGAFLAQLAAFCSNDK